eukprot:1161113-Pelagomonas_calceolata.AAC.6
MAGHAPGQALPRKRGGACSMWTGTPGRRCGNVWRWSYGCRLLATCSWRVSIRSGSRFGKGCKIRQAEQAEPHRIVAQTTSIYNNDGVERRRSKAI